MQHSLKFNFGFCEWIGSQQPKTKWDVSFAKAEKQRLYESACRYYDQDGGMNGGLQVFKAVFGGKI
jgi:hypothetical protein